MFSKGVGAIYNHIRQYIILLHVHVVKKQHVHACIHVHVLTAAMSGVAILSQSAVNTRTTPSLK